jgi:hypothetical protein
MRPRSIPPVPPADAVVLLKEEAAGLLRMSTRRFDELRREMPHDFEGNPHPLPKAYVLGGVTRWMRSELMAWFVRLPRGWSQMGQKGAA